MLAPLWVQRIWRTNMMNNSKVWTGREANTPFAPVFRMPYYIAKHGTEDFKKRLVDYCLQCEKILETEELVSGVIKNTGDPYEFTQHWKQHNLLDDSGDRKGGNHLERFPTNDIQKELFNIIREHYLRFMIEQGYARRKVYIHTWANCLRKGQHVNRHCHVSGENSYLACVYYPQASNTSLYLASPYDQEQALAIQTVSGGLVLWPSWVVHGTDQTLHDLRVSVASDIVTVESMEANPWRPHILFDDPETMPGLY